MTPKILIVDDKLVNIQIISRFLSKHNFDIQSAESGQEALELCREFEPDVVLMDICMPGMDGIECASHIKSMIKKNVFFIFITALKDQETKRRAFEIGAVSYFNKPVDLMNLLSTIKKCITVDAWDGSSSESPPQASISSVNSSVNKKSAERLKETRPSSFDPKLIQHSRLKDLGALSSSMVHDINNFLGGILGNVCLIEMSTEDSEILGCCKEIKKAVKSTSDLTDKMTAYARKGVGSSSAVNIIESLNDAINMIEKDSRYSARLTFKVPEELVFVEGAYSDLTNIFLNLLKNAFQAVSDNGLIEVNFECVELQKETGFLRNSIGPGRYCCIKIKDNGAGIPQKIIDHIFEPFFTTKQEGTGLGLSSVINLIDEHKGAFDISSVVDEGTCASVYLPVNSAGNLKTKIEFNQGSETVDLTGKRIVIMDDDIIFCNSLSGYLKKHNARVVSFTDKSFNSFIQANPKLNDYDILIIDFKSPFVDSLELIKDITAKNKHIMTYLISGAEVDIKGLERCDYFRKPVSFEKLAQEITSPGQ